MLKLLLTTSHCITPPQVPHFPHSRMSESYNGLFSLLLTASLISHSLPDSLHSNCIGFLTVPCAHRAGFYRRAFTLVVPSWCAVLFPHIQCGLVITVVEVPVLTAIASSFPLPAWVTCFTFSLFSMALITFVYSPVCLLCV